MSIPARVTGMLSGQMEPSELRRCEKEIAAEVNRLLGAFVIAGIVGPEDVKKDGTLKEEKEYRFVNFQSHNTRQTHSSSSARLRT